MYKKILRIVITKAIQKHDKVFMNTPVYKSICDYIGVPDTEGDLITVYEYSIRSKRDYSVCKRIASSYGLGFKIGGKRMLNADEVTFIDTRKK